MPQAVEARVSYAQMQAIASPTRFPIVRLLRDRRAHVSEIAEAVDVSKSTAHAALEILESSGLVRRVPDERVWVYYDLTPLGRIIATSDPLHLVVDVSLALAASFVLAGLLLYERLREREPPWYIPPIGVPPDPAPPLYARVETWIVLATLALIVCLARAAWGWARLRRRARQFG